MLPKEPVSSKLKIRLYEAYLDQDKRYNIAEIIVSEKIKQSLNLFKELSGYHGEIDIGKLGAGKLHFFLVSNDNVDEVLGKIKAL